MEDVLEDRAGIHFPGCDRAVSSNSALEFRQRLIYAHLARELEAAKGSGQRFRPVREDPIALRIALDVVEQQGRPLPLVVQLAARAEFQIQVGAVNSSDLVEIVELGYELAKVRIGHSKAPAGACRASIPQMWSARYEASGQVA